MSKDDIGMMKMGRTIGRELINSMFCRTFLSISLVYPLVLKRGHGKSPTNGGFHGKSLNQMVDFSARHFYQKVPIIGGFNGKSLPEGTNHREQPLLNSFWASQLFTA